MTRIAGSCCHVNQKGNPITPAAAKFWNWTVTAQTLCFSHNFAPLHLPFRECNARFKLKREPIEEPSLVNPLCLVDHLDCFVGSCVCYALLLLLAFAYFSQPPHILSRPVTFQAPPPATRRDSTTILVIHLHAWLDASVTILCIIP